MSDRPAKRKRRNQNYTDKTNEEVIDVDAASDFNRIGGDDDDDNDNDHQQESSSLLNTHPHCQLPSFLSEAFSDLYEQDGLVVMGRGLGWLGKQKLMLFYDGCAYDIYAYGPSALFLQNTNLPLCYALILAIIHEINFWFP